MTRANETSEKALEITQCAYLNAATPIAFFKSGRIRVNLENAGRMPATHVKWHLHILRMQIGIPVRDDAYEMGGDDTQIPPGTGHYGGTFEIRNFSPSEINLIDTSQETLYVAATIDYDNGFGHVRHTAICFKYDPDPLLIWDACPITHASELPPK